MQRDTIEFIYPLLVFFFWNFLNGSCGFFIYIFREEEEVEDDGDDEDDDAEEMKSVAS